MKILKEIPYYRLCGLSEWRMVKGHPRYSVSCNGDVLNWSWGRWSNVKICKIFKEKNGYMKVSIDEKKFWVHRIVADAFIPNPQNKPCVDHINTIREDNRVENLQWTTYKENCNNPITNNRQKENAAMLGKFGSEHPKAKEIVQLTLNGRFVKKWSCAAEVERELGIYRGNITNCCRGKNKSAGGYKWMYYSDYFKRKKSIKDIKPLF